MTEIQQIINHFKVCVVIPTYNNAGTIVDVVKRTAAITEHIIVVTDGCTDDTRERLKEFKDGELEVIDLPENHGKGYALLTGFKRAINKGYEYALTIDGDGQHYPEDIPLLVKAMEQNPKAIIVGSRNLDQDNMSGGSTFANKFSNFWFAVQTGVRLPDTQTGFRLYPLNHLAGRHMITNRYEAELELLVFAAWEGNKLIPIPVRVFYPSKDERVSHFRPIADFARISLLNTLFCIIAICYGWPKTLLRKLKVIR